MKNTENTETGVSKSKFSIVRAISTLLKLGNDGKIESFLEKVIRQLKKEVTVYKKNLDTLSFNYEQTVEELKEKLEDALDAYEHSLLEIDPAKVGTNEQQSAYIEVYLDNIDLKALAIKALEEEIAEKEESYKKEKETIEKQISSLTKRIEAVSAQA